MCTPAGRPACSSWIFCLIALGDGQRVLAVAHHDGAADDLVAVLLEDAAAELGAELHGGHVLDVDRRARRAR